MRMLFLFVTVMLSPWLHSQDVCRENGSYPSPALSDNTRKDYEAKLAIANQEYARDSSDAEAIIWLGRRTAYLGKYKEAIGIFSKGIDLHPKDARLYRHRGHRYLTLRCFDKAIGDFRKATELIKGKPDEIEPDGLPNAQNIPTSTLQSNIWYHLGLAYYLKGEYKNASNAYKQCLRASTNPDMYVATANWYYITLLKLKKNKEARKLLGSIQPDIKLIENKDYLDILLLFKEQKDPAVSFRERIDGNTLSSATYGYGLANYALMQNKTEIAKQVLSLILKGNQWSSFGFIATEVELERLK